VLSDLLSLPALLTLHPNFTAPLPAQVLTVDCEDKVNPLRIALPHLPIYLSPCALTSFLEGKGVFLFLAQASLFSLDFP
jgi:hypothetical protein